MVCERGEGERGGRGEGEGRERGGREEGERREREGRGGERAVGGREGEERGSTEVEQLSNRFFLANGKHFGQKKNRRVKVRDSQEQLNW